MHGPAPVSADPATPPTADLADAVRQLRRGTALVVGDAMLDRYVFGRVERVSPEAPVPVLCVEREVALPGGAGNVVRNLTALGVAVAFVSVVGDDQAGSDLTGLIGGQPGVEPWLLVQGGRATTTKTRFMAAGQQLLRADHENTAPIHPRLAERLVRIASDAVAATAVMVLSDYRKGVLAADTAAQLIAAARAAGRKVVVDPKGGAHARFAGADLIIATSAELAESTGLPASTRAEAVAAARALRAAHGFGAVLVLRGETGLTLVEAPEEPGGEERVSHMPCDVADVVDPAGADDAVVAVAAAGLSAGLPLRVSARLGALAAGIVMGKTGISVVREDEFLEVLQPGWLARRKLVTRAQAMERAERWRRAGWRIGLIAGSAMADLPGVLAQARAWCDRLVVALHEADGRAEALAELAEVDLVTRFTGDSPVELIRLLRPDVLVQDPEHAPETVAGGEVVQEWGGEIRRPVIAADTLGA
ncbi:PfkB family carbohydrate kinase [Crenalkalicoccus roseus]|uniref:PfkB family carbohydrate kinase n=1 Tax=Crenalkalicoccus roseus TaxID=1485588 RepID=UPI0010807A23|nr:PfkB family carbohydrate kinase [Crenalkalicoccus roseus]